MLYSLRSIFIVAALVEGVSCFAALLGMLALQCSHTVYILVLILCLGHSFCMSKCGSVDVRLLGLAQPNIASALLFIKFTNALYTRGRWSCWPRSLALTNALAFDQSAAENTYAKLRFHQPCSSVCGSAATHAFLECSKHMLWVVESTKSQ